jgi:hypothetical protein
MFLDDIGQVAKSPCSTARIHVDGIKAATCGVQKLYEVWQRGCMIGAVGAMVVIGRPELAGWSLVAHWDYPKDGGCVAIASHDD